jgi:hypothetical protein
MMQKKQNQAKRSQVWTRFSPFATQDEDKDKDKDKETDDQDYDKERSKRRGWEPRNRKEKGRGRPRHDEGVKDKKCDSETMTKKRSTIDYDKMRHDSQVKDKKRDSQDYDKKHDRPRYHISPWHTIT